MSTYSTSIGRRGVIGAGLAGARATVETPECFDFRIGIPHVAPEGRSPGRAVGTLTPPIADDGNGPRRGAIR